MDLVKTHLENETWYPDMPMQYDFFMHIRSKSLAILSAVMFLMILDYWLLQKKKNILHKKNVAVASICRDGIGIHNIFSESKNKCYRYAGTV